MDSKTGKKKKILIGIDASENSRIASEYVCEMCIGEKSLYEIILVHIIPRVKSDEEAIMRGLKIDEIYAEIHDFMKRIKDDFVKAGFCEEMIRIEIERSVHDTAADGLLEYIKREQFHAVVLGRRGICKSEEFLFGSVTKKIVSEAKGCAIWVVEPQTEAMM